MNESLNIDHVEHFPKIQRNTDLLGRENNRGRPRGM